MGVQKSPGPRSERVFAGRSAGTTTCEHSQELTPGLLELKRPVYLWHSCSLRLFRHLRATPVSPLATVPPGDHFLSPVSDGR